MEFLPIIVPIWIAMGVLGAWVAMQKNRSPVEGLMLGILFGPFGVLIIALLPNTPSQGTQAADRTDRSSQTRVRSLDERGQIAYLETRYRELLDEVEPNWRSLSYHRKKAVMKQFDRKLMKELKLTASQFDDLSIEAARSILKT
jgi:hypothetical protein